ncbi:MAG: DUF2029 domain-containing protein [Anaerolineales bacterium]|nr:DUF2029 domain-containing protein [Anaerolineales bacterium]
MPKPQKVTQAFLAARKELILWGSISAGIYLAFVLVFPLIPYIYHEGKMLDLEMILRNGTRELVWVYILGLGVLFYAFWRIMQTLQRFSKEYAEKSNELRKLTLGFAAACGLILLGLYPITALDVAVYVVNARNWVLYNANPLFVPPGAFPNDPLSQLAGEYVDKTSPYGPVWEVMGRIPVQLGIRDIGAGIIAMKVISLLAFMGMAYLIGWYSKQQDEKFAVSRVTALAFFALNPLVLLEALGNGHNDMSMAAFVMLGLILWQRGKWMWAALALTVASLIKLPALIFLPLFGLNLLMDAPTWKERITRTLGLGVIVLGVFFLAYRLMGPFPEVFSGIVQSFARRSFSPAYAIYVIVRELSPEISKLILPNTRYLFLLIYAFITIALLRRKLTLLEAGFLTYFAMIYLSNAFRMWYPLWFIPFAALNLNSRTFWRTFLFSLTVEFSILSYYILWRWYWRTWDWGLTGPLAPYWDYFKIMTPFTVSWVFTLPFLADLTGWWKDKKKYAEELWL